MERFEPSHQPVARLGVDFGAGSLVIARGVRGGSGCHTLGFPGWSQEMTRPAAGEPVHSVPVLVHYDEGGGRILGDEVVRAGKCGHPATARWIRKYLLEESPVRIPVTPESHITFRDAATDFLTTVLSRASQVCPGQSSVVFALPPESPEWYTAWLGSIAQAAGIRYWHTVSEPAAIVAGYGLIPEGEKDYLIIRWDETDLSASFIRSDDASDEGSAGGLIVTGTAYDNTGCSAMDLWVAQDILDRSPVKFTRGKEQRLREEMAGKIKERYGQLAAAGGVTMVIGDPLSGTTTPACVSHEDIGRILQERGFGSILDSTIDRARAAAQAHGSDEMIPAAVMMVGRGCAFPGVLDLIKKRYGDLPVYSDHPFDAIARGAAFSLPPANRSDLITHDYALRYWEPKTREHRYRFLVRSGARYPSAGQVARITISAAYDGQTRLGIPLYEIRTRPDAQVPSLELVSDATGGIRLAGPPEDTGTENRPLLANGREPVLLPADPPALKGEPRFELTFRLDGERKLLVTARDLVTGILVKKDTPVHQLS
ncbi:hypothetical protein [Methanoregula sp.]|uniref:hypothetical protein n=1 Tax=Methanoregula sp. TaxID=2052170 RepID=UPI002BE39EEA|nr:hypothetical protein [Methanoregula sp.]HVP96220.1 hypothetical protein [Methanoregula sp.]